MNEKFRVSRRAVLAATGLVLLADAPSLAASNEASQQQLATQAAIWGFPLVQIGRYFALAQKSHVATNRFYLNETLATPATKLAAPNIDTIYGFAWLDLSQGPVVLDLPDSGINYYTVQLIDAYQTILGYAGKGGTAAGPGLYVITPPGWHSTIPAGAKQVAATTTLVLALARTLVAGDTGLEAAQRLQTRYILAPLSGYPVGRQSPVVQGDALNLFPKLDLSSDSAAYFSDLDALVRRYPPPPREAPVFDQLAPLALGTGAVTRLPPDTLRGALAEALQKIKSFSGTVDSNGWRVNYHITNFIADPLARASTNLVGPGANVAAQSLYFVALHDADGDSLTGEDRYTITFPKGDLPPVRAFWSLILYSNDLLLVDNPAGRYAITDRTAGLQYGSDGSLRIVIRHTTPANTANWLPAPAGAFRLILRAYAPDEALLSGAYKLPRIVRLDGAE